jgi:hypothetical protein
VDTLSLPEGDTTHWTSTAKERKRLLKLKGDKVQKLKKSERLRVSRRR